MRSLFLLSGAALLGLAACHRDSPAPNPCLSQLANPLRFRFLEGYGTPTPDTAYTKQDITFEGPGAPYTSYKWKVGNDARVFTKQKFSLYFYDTELGRYPVRLIAKRPLNKACFPNDDGVDTLTQVLTLVPLSRRSPLYGKYLGANSDAPTDTFTIRLFLGPNRAAPNDPAAEPYTYLRNLSKGCQSPYFDIGSSWRGINFNYGRADFSCNTETGTGYLTTRDSIRIDYERSEPYPVRKSHVFRGRRVR